MAIHAISASRVSMLAHSVRLRNLFLYQQNLPHKQPGVHYVDHQGIDDGVRSLHPKFNTIARQNKVRVPTCACLTWPSGEASKDQS
jgi:hypothetical protein